MIATAHTSMGIIMFTGFTLVAAAASRWMTATATGLPSFVPGKMECRSKKHQNNNGEYYRN